MTTEHKPHSDLLERADYWLSDAPEHADFAWLSETAIKDTRLLAAAYLSAQDELRRIANDPARALSLRERGVVDG